MRMPALAVLAAIGVLLPTLAFADPSLFVGTWLVDVKNSPRQRAMTVTQGADGLSVRFGFADGQQPQAESSLSESGELTVKTRTGATVVLRLVDDNALQGQFTGDNGKTQVASAVRTVAVTAGTAAAATDLSVGHLGKPDVLALASGRIWTMVRLADNNTIRFDVQKDGYLMASNNYQRDTGNWTVDDQDRLCVKWRGSSTDRCMFVTKVDGKYELIDAASPSQIYAHLTVE